ncbi:protein-cysteine N-palmitoyltransferase HHAT isoform X1 [Poecilia latipinna]|uniref:protein-cysteine N-palmitoyltransferase HHAT isoform X1 n=1 Tax=Poecilia latipinna TaxID=48699 RepID=UPI00072D930E|nr:PREDICTED: protein-cysteine N-palmitoyltransferase HHAT isoform X1 [Poecilia latipinna]XP_014907393.1 PREDICTED: protein-cysteine N-palmitoyltransferase HHAT isoform X1 [Poecilia latipinna]
MPSRLSPLPWPEIFVYWLLSFGSHLYSFYQLHKFSKEHEAGLQREFQLENGLFNGFKRDPSDFEWSFWTEWAKKSLLWTLVGHGVLSRLAAIFHPRLKVLALFVFDFLAASSLLGFKGVGVLLLQLSVAFSVAQLRKPPLAWIVNLLLLSTIHIQPLQHIQRGWYSTEEEYYLLLFSVAVCGLRFISFSLEHCWSPLECGRVAQLFWLFSYTFYHPFFYNGPIITFKAYAEQMRKPADENSGQESVFGYVLVRSARVILWWVLAEYMIHVMYMHSIHSNETYIEMLPPWALELEVISAPCLLSASGGLALALVQFFYVKYLVLFGLPSMLATLDGLVPPKLPRCVSIMHSFTGMWRHFDEGLYRWLIRYIYVPLGGSRHGPLSKVFSTGVAFAFVCFWHGGQDYLRYWALMNWAGVLVENAIRSLFGSSRLHSVVEQNFSLATRRRCAALLCAFSTAMLILSNLVFLGGTHVGRIFWKRVFVQGWSTVAPPMLAFLYCFAQVGLERTSSPL